MFVRLDTGRPVEPALESLIILFFYARKQTFGHNRLRKELSHRFLAGGPPVGVQFVIISGTVEGDFGLGIQPNAGRCAPRSLRRSCSDLRSRPGGTSRYGNNSSHQLGTPIRWGFRDPHCPQTEWPHLGGCGNVPRAYLSFTGFSH